MTNAFAGIDLCRRDPLCETLKKYSSECFESLAEKSCNQFADTFEKLLVPRTCNIDGEQIQFSIQSCEDVELHYDRLSKLPFKKALSLFASSKIRQTMKDKVSELYTHKSLETSKRLGKNLRPGKVISECREFEYIETKSVTCTVPGLLPTDIVSKASKAQVFKFEGSDAPTGKRQLTLVEMKTCKKIWQSEWGTAETVTGEGNHLNTINKVSSSVWKQCEPCWNHEKEACLRIN